MSALEILNQQELQRDMAFCGCSLAEHRETSFAYEGAHDPTATRYFILEQLFQHFHFTEKSHLLDVGCGAGRALAYFAQAKYPGKATGVELDSVLAKRAQSWSSKYAQLTIMNDNVLNMSLWHFTDFYLFNPFDTRILQQFIEKIEQETSASVEHPITLVHASDNGEGYSFMGRLGWTLKAEGWFHTYEGEPIFGCAQHWSVWEFAPHSLKGATKSLC